MHLHLCIVSLSAQTLLTPAERSVVDPTVSFGDSSGLKLGSFGSESGFFVCPFDDDDALTDTYCCGPSDREICCGYWDK